MIDEKIKKRKPTLFEFILILMGVLAIGIGGWMVYNMASIFGPYGFETTIILMLWILMVLAIILIAINENSKEEMKIIQKELYEEIKIMRNDMRRKR